MIKLALELTELEFKVLYEAAHNYNGTRQRAAQSRAARKLQQAAWTAGVNWEQIKLAGQRREQR